MLYLFLEMCPRIVGGIPASVILFSELDTLRDIPGIPGYSECVGATTNIARVAFLNFCFSTELYANSNI